MRIPGTGTTTHGAVVLLHPGGATERFDPLRKEHHG
jgi:hypothetical protein